MDHTFAHVNPDTRPEVDNGLRITVSNGCEYAVGIGRMRGVVHSHMNTGSVQYSDTAVVVNNLPGLTVICIPGDIQSVNSVRDPLCRLWPSRARVDFFESKN